MDGHQLMADYERANDPRDSNFISQLELDRELLDNQEQLDQDEAQRKELFPVANRTSASGPQKASLGHDPQILVEQASAPKPSAVVDDHKPQMKQLAIDMSRVRQQQTLDDDLERRSHHQNDQSQGNAIQMHVKAKN